MKIIEKLMRAQDAGRDCLSFEYYPPKQRSRWGEFYEKIERMSRLGPDFIDVTWGTGTSTSLASLEVSQQIQRITNIDTMMHLTCTHRTKDELYEILKTVRDSGMDNIMALRGNRPVDGSWLAPDGGFGSAAELVDFIRDAFKRHFCISVAAYPEGHREGDGVYSEDYYSSQPYWEELRYLKSKVDAGADFIVTQLCFDLERLKQFSRDCRSIGITCPIIPGLLPIHSKNVYEKIDSFSATIPSVIRERVEGLREGEFEEYALELLTSQVIELREFGFFAIHLYTLNFERIISEFMKTTGRV